MAEIPKPLYRLVEKIKTGNGSSLLFTPVLNIYDQTVQLKVDCDAP